MMWLGFYAAVVGLGSYAFQGGFSQHALRETRSSIFRRIIYCVHVVRSEILVSGSTATVCEKKMTSLLRGAAGLPAVGFQRPKCNDARFRPKIRTFPKTTLSRFSQGLSGRISF